MIWVGKSKISGRGCFATRLLRPGCVINDNPARKIGFNHSCEPNCLLVRNRRGTVWFVVPIRLIKKGEELTVDYRHGDRRTFKPFSIMRKPPNDCRPCKCPACKEEHK